MIEKLTNNINGYKYRLILINEVPFYCENTKQLRTLYEYFKIKKLI